MIRSAIPGEFPRLTLAFFAGVESDKLAMSLKVLINSDVYRCCYHHALSTESEEVLGLLIGEKKIDKENENPNVSGVGDVEIVDSPQTESKVVEIVGLQSCVRLDRRKDRVEISHEQMIEASAKAEELRKKLFR